MSILKQKVFKMQTATIKRKFGKYWIYRNINGRIIEYDKRDSIGEVLEDAQELGILHKLNKCKI